MPLRHARNRTPAQMKLLFFINSLSAGGAERVMAKLADFFVDEGHDVTLLTQTPVATDHYPTAAKRQSIEAGKVSRHPIDALRNNLRRLRRLRRAIEEVQPDAVLAFMPTANVLALMAARQTGTPVVVSERVHPPFLELSAVRRWLQRRYYPGAARIVVLSSASADWFDNRYGLTNTVVIPNSINLPLAHHEPVVNPGDVVPGDRRLVLSVGRLVPQKQPEMVLETFAAAADDAWHLVMIGSGSKADALEQLAMRLGIAERFSLLPRVGNMQDWYERASIYVSASSYEGFPNALLEAMACGCACLAFDCPTGPRDLIVDKQNGLLVALEDLSGFRSGLASLCRDEPLRERLAGAARANADRFSDQRVLPQWLSVMTEACR